MPHLTRRELLQTIGGATALSMLTRYGLAFGIDMDPNQFSLVPPDKKLSPDWIKSLTARGEPQRWTGAELKWIGMPISGIGTGQLYLGGDGSLWLWNIIKADNDGGTRGETYEHTPDPEKHRDLDQGFAIQITQDNKTAIKTLDKQGFSDITFVGQYPIGRVSYRDATVPVTIDLEAWTPFVPLNVADSAQPVTVMSYTIRNTSSAPAEVSIAGWLQNAVNAPGDLAGEGAHRMVFAQTGHLASIVGTSEDIAEKDVDIRPDVVFADFEGPTYQGWTSEGQAFGDSPFPRKQMESYHNVTGQVGEQLVNSHNTRLKLNVTSADDLTGKLISDAFTISRNYINFKIDGGNKPKTACINLIVDKKIVRTATGKNSNEMRQESWNVSEFAGKAAHIEIVDDAKGSWGNIGIDQIVFSDKSIRPTKVADKRGYGSMAISVLADSAMYTCDLADTVAPADLFKALDSKTNIAKPFGQKQRGAIGTRVVLAPGESRTISFLITWWFPFFKEVGGPLGQIQDLAKLKRFYATSSDSALKVAQNIARDFDRLHSQTQLWNKTWYDSTLPHWLLDRAMIPLDTIATQTCYLFDSGRFYGWEGVTCCPGTCQHVWNYAQALARIFPSLEADLRQRVDYGLAYHDTGATDYRGESGKHVAHDGQCGTIIRAYREHQMSKDDTFLKPIWPRVKQSIVYLIDQDKDGDGILEGEQYNTLDASWYGPMAWISSMFGAALRCGEAMARDMGDEAFAKQCAELAQKNHDSVTAKLFNGEYFIHIPPDFKHTNTNKGCHIDQVFGQSLAYQVGLTDRILPKKQTISALQALWKYNFAPDAWDYRQKHQDKLKGGRAYAMAGESGLLMTTWPMGGDEVAHGNGPDWAVGYFNECMNGFEYQVASHMIYEGDADLVEKGLAITRAVHDRYAAAKRNPYNEVECGDHYSRSMASYGAFLAVCGWRYHGPRGFLAFAPRITPDNFRAPFTAAEGWGTMSQTIKNGTQTQTIEIKYGSLRLTETAFTLANVAPDASIASIKCRLGDQDIPATTKRDGPIVSIRFEKAVVVSSTEPFIVEINVA